MAKATAEAAALLTTTTTKSKRCQPEKTWKFYIN